MLTAFFKVREYADSPFPKSAEVDDTNPVEIL